MNMEIVKTTTTPHNYPMSVCLLAYCTLYPGKILVVRRKSNREKLCLPGGKVQEHESTQEALIRESLEETGLSIDASEVYPVYAGLCEDDSGNNFYWNTCYLKRVDSSELSAVALEPELDSHWCSVEEFLEKNAFKVFNSRAIANVAALGIFNT